jgi:HAD superfamily hydrolase (TIGR01509 family)
MNIIIPLGGKGERFSKNGYTLPKPLIPIFEKTMIEYVLDNIVFDNNDTIYIIYNTALDNYNFVSIITKRYPQIKCIPIHDTSGAAETLYIGLTHIIHKDSNIHKKCLILDCDTFYTEDIVSIFRNSQHNMVFYTTNTSPNAIYSYITMDTNNIITNIKEKEKISDNANSGAYAFIDIYELHKYCKYVIDNNILFNNEPYTSCVIHEMIFTQLNNKHIFVGYELNPSRVFSLGTPDAVELYKKNTYAFLMDLDGTLVLSDTIYFDVWYEILQNYNIVLTPILFNKYIVGNNDNYVCNSLLKNANVDELSELKDTLFIKNIIKIGIIDGIYEFLLQIKNNGHKCCVVTNCNKRVAESIVKHIHIDGTIDFIISNNDSPNPKPHGDPYMCAIQKYNISNNKCIIFEDSKSGIISGKSVNPKLLVGVETIYTKNVLLQYGTHTTITNYVNCNVHDFIHMNTNNIVLHHLQNSLLCNTNNITIDCLKMKGGFIADVISFKVKDYNNNICSYVVKYENSEINNLSIIAKRLDLYNREYYFYSHISSYINVKIPRFVSLLMNDESQPCGIILENLNDKNYVINLNLNELSIDISLKIIDRMVLMHSKFWNKNLKKRFSQIKQSNDPSFSPFFKEFISERYDIFISNWKHILNDFQLKKCQSIFNDFENIQNRLSEGQLTFIHGDIKSPNIFYDVSNNYEPYFIDWQHCAFGKGCQDLIFFIIESFSIENIKIVYPLFIHYYYKKLIEYGIVNYDYNEYLNDILDSLYYVPFFTSIWFGTIPQDELIDKNFPFFFINKLFYLIEMISK